MKDTFNIAISEIFANWAKVEEKTRTELNGIISEVSKKYNINEFSICFHLGIA